MSTPRPSPATRDLHAVIDEAYPRLVGYALRLLRHAGWVEGKDHLPVGMQPCAAVGDAVARYLAGTRRCPEGVDLEAFLYGVMKSLAYHATHDDEAQVQKTPIDDAFDLAAPSSRRDERIDQRRLLGAIAEELAVDPETDALFNAMRSGEGTPAAQAAALGWPSQHVNAVHHKMNRRLDAAGLSDGDDDERRDRSPRAAPALRGSPRRGAP